MSNDSDGKTLVNHVVDTVAWFVKGLYDNVYTLVEKISNGPSGANNEEKK